MPTYEYVCRDCGHHLEVVQSFRDDPLTVCGRCEGSLRKVFSPAGIIFKGSGYYVTDSRPAPASEGASGEGAAKSDAGDGGKSDAGGKSKEGADKGGSSTANSGGKGSGSKGSGSKGSGSKGSGDAAQSA